MTLADPARTALAAPGAPTTFDIAAFLTRIDPRRLEARRAAADKARRLIESKRSEPAGFSEAELRELFALLQTDFRRNKEYRDRYGRAFSGDLANKIIERLDVASVAILNLWRAGDEGDEDEIYQALDAFYAAGIPGAGRSLPTAILHVMAPSRFFALMPSTMRGYVNLTGDEPPRDRSAAAYRRFVEGVRALVAKHDIPPDIVDSLLSGASQHEPIEVEEPAPQEAPASQFSGFTRDAFAFLAELGANNRQDWFRANKARFKEAVDRPLRALVADLGARFIGPLNPEIEITPNSHKTIAKIRRNIYGKQTTDCYYTYYWGAFYRAGRSRSTDAQLYVNVFADRFETGFYTGAKADEVHTQLVNAVRRHPGLVSELLADIDATDELAIVSTGQSRAARGERIAADSPEQLAHAFEVEDARICRIFEPHDPIVALPSLVDEIWATFEKVYPFFLLATSATPVEDIEAFRAGQRGSAHDQDDDPDADIPVYERADLLRDTRLTDSELRDIEALLADKRQLIFHGPPGTGKTFIGERIARFLAGARGDVKIVQFHPSYAYEDFVEGIRPGIGKQGLVELDVHDGVFKRLCDAARQRPQGKFVLVVDEINRGNLPRIFGELLYLLENRGSKVDLPYSKKPFAVPENIYIIGTMNSADHSIALVDVALRRRFHFVYLAPNPDLLRAWLKAHRPRMLHVAEALERLNRQLLEEGIEKELLVGHSHFMRPNLDEARLRLIWKHTVQPLLEEYFYGRSSKVEAFTYDVFFDELEASSDAAADALLPDDPADDGSTAA